MQRALHGEGTSEGGAKGEASAGNGPDRGELRPCQQHHEPPRTRPVSDRLMPQGGQHTAGQGGQHTAGQGEHPGPDTGRGAVRPRPTGAAVEGRRALALDRRPSFRRGTLPAAGRLIARRPVPTDPRVPVPPGLKDIRKRRRSRSPAGAGRQEPGMSAVRGVGGSRVRTTVLGRHGPGPPPAAQLRAAGPVTSAAGDGGQHRSPGSSSVQVNASRPLYPGSACEGRPAVSPSRAAPDRTRRAKAHPRRPACSAPTDRRAPTRANPRGVPLDTFCIMQK
jgi:hypothetical protein